MEQSQKQALRVRRAMYANLGALSNVFLCSLAAYIGYFVIDLSTVLFLSLSIWLGHLLLVLSIAFNFNLKFKDPSLTLPQMVWITSAISVLMIFMQDIRPLMLMGYLLVMSFGAFRLSLKEFYGFTAYTLCCYLLSIYIIGLYRPNDIQFSSEFFMFLGFVFALFGLTLMGTEFSQLRQTLGLRHKELQSAFSRIEELAITDELTGLYNRRHLMQVLNQQRALANRGQYGFVLCYLDLDHFKKVNDQYGHIFGDKVLVAFSRLISACLREVDIGARLGGEEFVLILADTQLMAAYKVCQRMSDKWNEMHFTDEPKLSLTFSAGIAQFRPTESNEQLLERADALLYEAKESGRHRIVLERQDLQAQFDFEIDALSR